MVCSDSERIAHGPFRRASSFGADHERLRVLVRRRQALDDAARRPRMGYPGRPPRTGETPEKASGGSSSRKRRPRRSGWSCSRTKRSSFTPRSRRITVIRTLRAIRCSTAGRVGRLHPLDPTIETHGRGFFGPEEARQLEWIERHRELYDAALERMLGR